MMPFPGWKTYAVGAAMVLAGGMYQQGYINENTYRVVEGLLMGGGLMALRAAVSKAGK